MRPQEDRPYRGIRDLSAPLGTAKSEEEANQIVSEEILRRKEEYGKRYLVSNLLCTCASKGWEIKQLIKLRNDAPQVRKLLFTTLKNIFTPGFDPENYKHQSFEELKAFKYAVSHPQDQYFIKLLSSLKKYFENSEADQPKVEEEIINALACCFFTLPHVQKFKYLIQEFFDYYRRKPELGLFVKDGPYRKNLRTEYNRAVDAAKIETQQRKLNHRSKLMFLFGNKKGLTPEGQTNRYQFPIPIAKCIIEMTEEEKPISKNANDSDCNSDDSDSDGVCTIS